MMRVTQAMTLLLAMSPSAAADELRARHALAVALQRATTEAMASPRLSFTETVAEKGVIVSARFDPRQSRGKTWRPIGPLPPRGQEQTTYRGIVHDTPDERDILLARVGSSIVGEGTLVSEAAGGATFDFALSPAAKPTNTPLDSALNLSAHIRVQLGVDEATQTLTGMRFYAPTPFSATPLARVTNIDVRFAFGASYPGGPTVLRQVDTDAGYSVIGVATRTRDTVWFKDVEPVAAAALNARPRAER